MENNEKANLIINSIPEKDAHIVLEIIEKTIEVLNINEQMPDAEFAALTEHRRYIERITPKIEKFKLSDKLSTIFIRFVGNETPVAETLFYPIEAVWAFLSAARNYYNTPGTTLTTEEIEKFSFNKAVDMFCIMLKIIYPRLMATISSITDETINEWYRQENEDFREYFSRKGIVTENNEANIKQAQRDIFDDHNKQVSGIWNRYKKNNLNFQKMRFAEEYEILKPHWDTISYLYRGKKDWRGYSKMNGFEDTPDDLLDEMKGSHHRGMSLKALEHAARRVGLLNINNKEKEVLEKRKIGLQVSGFAENTLFKFLDEGRETMEMVQEQQRAVSALKKS